MITKFDQQFNSTWSKTIHEPGLAEKSLSFSQDSLGDLYIVGYSNFSCLILKTDSILNIIWRKLIQYPNYFGFSEILIYSSSSIYFLGQVQHNGGSSFEDSLLLVNIDSSGSIIWSKTYDASNGWNIGVGIYPGLSNNLIVGNWDTRMHNYGGISSYDLSGNKLWDNRWNIDGFSTNPFGVLFSTSTGNTGEIVLYGLKAPSNSYDPRNFVMTCSLFGNQVLWREYGIEYDSLLYALNYITGIHTSDGGYVFKGYISLPNSISKTVLVKLDNNLIPQWCRMYDITNTNYRAIQNLVQTIDNGFLIAGDYQNDILLIKTDSLGYSGCIDSTLNVFSQPTSSWQVGYSGSQSITILTSPYSPVITNIPITNNIDTLCSLYMGVEIPSNDFYFTISPNPASTQFTIRSYQDPIKEIEIFNLLGEKIYSTSLSRESCIVLPIAIGSESFPSGIYFVSVTTDQGAKATSKIVIVR